MLYFICRTLSTEQNKNGSNLWNENLISSKYFTLAPNVAIGNQKKVMGTVVFKSVKNVTIIYYSVILEYEFHDRRSHFNSFTE